MDAGSRTATPDTAQAETANQTPDEAFWICFERQQSVVVCRCCELGVVLPYHMLIHAHSLGAERWHLRCAGCSHPYSIADFIEAGATLKRGSDAILGMSEPN